jgi:hypothetical protein
MLPKSIVLLGKNYFLTEIRNKVLGYLENV